MTGTQLKILIIVLIILMLISLFNGLFILFKDNGAPDSKRTFRRLVLRVVLASAIFSAMGYGFYTGKLQNRAPWANPSTTSPSPVPTGR